LPQTNKLKILNDPIYGFITIPSEFIFDLIEHPYFQRLRRISQLGLTYLVYPGAYHTRFHHALGAMHLMLKAVHILRSKDVPISKEEEEAVLVAILLHDVGHGPFSHALENSIIPGIDHEDLSLEFMNLLNREFHGKLDLAIAIFKNEYHRAFLHQLISSQLDMDRLDYLRRDSFYTGVSEGQVNTERLIQMLNVADDQLVVDSKGIYSVEKFLVARRLMYWQVYLHKTVLAAEFLLIKILSRAKDVYPISGELPSPLKEFIAGGLPSSYADLLPLYAKLDDIDVMAAIKIWSNCEDMVLSKMCNMLLQRRLPAVKISNKPFAKEKIKALREKLMKQWNLDENEAACFVFSDAMANSAYDPNRDPIKLMKRNGSLRDVSVAADQLSISALSDKVIRHFLFYPKSLRQS
jgi:HD superfamily phosphohydrolase